MRGTAGRLVRVLLGASLIACAADPPPEAAAATSADDDNIPGRASGWAQAQAGLSARRATAQAELGEANRALRTAGDACADACLLLPALHAAVTHLCEIRDNHDDTARCKESRKAVTAAAAKVATACNACKPVVDDDTPTPD